MSATFWLVFSIVCFSLAFVALVVAIFAFIKMNVPAIIGDINGTTVARGVEAMKKANERGAKQTFKDYGMANNKPIDIDLKASSDAMSRAHVSKRLDMSPDEAEAFAAQMHNEKGGTENIYHASDRVQDFSEQPKGIDYKTTPLAQMSAKSKDSNDYKTTPLAQMSAKSKDSNDYKTTPLAQVSDDSKDSNDYKTTPLAQMSAKSKDSNDYKTTPLAQKNVEDAVNQVALSQNNKAEKVPAYHTSVLNSETTVLSNSVKQQYGTTVLDGNSTVKVKQSVEIEITTKKISVNTDEII